MGASDIDIYGAVTKNSLVIIISEQRLGTSVLHCNTNVRRWFEPFANPVNHRLLQICQKRNVYFYTRWSPAPIADTLLHILINISWTAEDIWTHFVRYVVKIYSKVLKLPKCRVSWRCIYISPRFLELEWIPNRDWISLYLNTFNFI